MRIVKTDARERQKKIPKRVAGVVMSALSKSPAERTDSVCVWQFIAWSGGRGWVVVSTSFLLYEYFPKFVKLFDCAYTSLRYYRSNYQCVLAGDVIACYRGTKCAGLLIGVVGLSSVVTYMIAGAAFLV